MFDQQNNTLHLNKVYIMNRPEIVYSTLIKQYYVSVSTNDDQSNYSYVDLDGVLRDSCAECWYLSQGLAQQALDRHLFKTKVVKNKEKLNDREDQNVKHLSFISGLYVRRVRTNKGESVYEFFTHENKVQCIKGIFNYKKAKMFAEGVDVGRKLSHEN